jgi:hypothetical protein
VMGCSTTSCGYLISFIMVSKMAWSTEGINFMKSMYARKMSLLISLASSRATIIILDFFVLCSLQPKFFFYRVQKFTFSTMDGEKCGYCASVEIIYHVVECDWSIVSE